MSIGTCLSILSIFAAVAVALAAGLAILRLLLREETLRTPGPERWGLSWVLGMGYITLAMALLGWLVRGPWLVALISAGAGGLFLLSRPRKSTVTLERRPFTILEWLLITVLIAQAGFLVWWTPQLALGWDGMILWESRARIAAVNGGVVPFQFFSDPPLRGIHAHYPLYLPYTETWLYLWMGRADQAWVRICGPLFYLAGTCILGGAACRLGLPRAAAFAGAAAFFFVPYNFASYWNALSGYADFPLGICFLAAASRLPILASKGAVSDLRLFAVVAGLCGWVKQEGVYLWLILAGIAALLLLWRKQWKAAQLQLVPGIALVAGYAFFLRVADAPSDPYYHSPTPANLLAYSGRIFPVFTQFVHELLNLESWSLLWVGAALATGWFFIRRQWQLAIPLSLAIALPLFLYLWPFVLSALDVQAHIELALPRLLHQVAPTAMLAILLAAPRLSSTAKPNR